MVHLVTFQHTDYFSACNGQNTTQVVNNDLISQNSIVATGDTVSELGKSILIIFQSANGNYWFGSDVDGVYRYDGKNIIHFSTKHGLCNNTIRKLKKIHQATFSFLHSTVASANLMDKNLPRFRFQKQFT